MPGIGPGQLYHFQTDGPRDPERGFWYDGQARLIDPYAKALAGQFQKSDDGIIRPPKCVVVDDYFDWEGDRHLRRDLSETVIYEMHVRGFTRSKTSKVEYPGHLPGDHREDSLPEVVGDHGRRTDAGPRVSDPGHLGQRAGTAQLLGLRSDGVLRAASRLCGGERAGLPGAGIQADGQGAAPGGDRSDSGRGVQPHLRRQRTGPGPLVQGTGEPRLLPHCQRRQSLQQLLGLRQHDQRESSDRPRDDLQLPAALGAQLSRRRIPLRPGIDSQPQSSGAPGAQSAAGGNDRGRPDAGRHEDHRRGVGCRRRLSGRFVLGSFAVGGMERALSR